MVEVENFQINFILDQQIDQARQYALCLLVDQQTVELKNWFSNQTMSNVAPTATEHTPSIEPLPNCVNTASPNLGLWFTQQIIVAGTG